MNKGIRLSERLEAVVAAVNAAETAADIGTDHGYVPVELVRRGTVKRALAMDVRPGPLARAREHIAEAGLEDRIGTRLSDGLSELSCGEAETVIIAGMGGELILRIMEQGRRLWDSVGQWVLSPHSEHAKLRKWLDENGFETAGERMVYEAGKYYTVMDVRRNKSASKGKTAAERTETAERAGEAKGAETAETGAGPHKAAERTRDYLYGRRLIEARDPVLLRYLKDEEKKLSGLHSGLSGRTERSERAAVRLKEIEELLRINREVQDEMQ